jgi:hypothetical protein
MPSLLQVVAPAAPLAMTFVDSFFNHQSSQPTNPTQPQTIPINARAQSKEELVMLLSDASSRDDLQRKIEELSPSAVRGVVVAAHAPTTHVVERSPSLLS